MILQKCIRCKTRPAVIFIGKMENGKQVQEGYCIKCAKELGLKPIDDIISRMGISEEDLDRMSSQLDAVFPPNLFDGMTPEDADFEDVENAENAGNLMGKVSDASDGEPESDLPAEIADQPLDPDHPLNADDLKRRQMQQAANAAKKGKKLKQRFLDSFCINLSEKARSGMLDKVIGRERELDRVVQILCRRQKNNPCLIGEPGVGKTAIAEALAARIVKGDVPYRLIGKEVYLLDMTAIVAGTQYRGQFENRMKGLIDDVLRCKNVILFIDEVHSIIGAGNAEGGMNAANILKPALSRGEIQVIGATTLEEYRKYIEHDAALGRRFQSVLVNEPSDKETTEILRGIAHLYEAYHGIQVPDNLLTRIVQLSNRYLTERFQPDKAIDLLDEACTHALLRSPSVQKYDKAQVELEQLQKQQQQLEDRASSGEQDFRASAELKASLLKTENELLELGKARFRVRVTIEDIASVVELWTGIPASGIKAGDLEKLQSLPEQLKTHIIGQDEAIDKLCRAIRRARAGVAYKKKPISFIFAGSTGVGKTQLVKDLSGRLFDSEDALIRLDMSEYMEKYAVSRILGSPPGYVGYDDAGQLTEKVRRKPYSVVLFDEIEKAHPDVLNVLLQILDDGRVTDSHGKVINFENTILIMTTNAGATATNATGFTATARESDELRVRTALEAFLRPEFLNRIDEIVVFNRLSPEHFRSICRILLGELTQALAERSLTFSYTEAVVGLLSDEGYSEKYGARNLRRLIQTKLEDEIASVLVERCREKIRSIHADVQSGSIVVTANV